MNDLVKKLVTRLGESFTNLEEQEKEFNIQNEKLSEYNKLLDFVSGDAKKINKYEDQKLILNAVSEIDSTKEEYDAACYLLESNDDNVINLPQYRNSRIYLETIINYLNGTKDKIKNTVDELNSDCTDMRFNKKYYEILNNDYPFVEDIDEFEKLLDKEDIQIDDRFEIISFIIKSNVNHYKKRIKGEEK